MRTPNLIQKKNTIAILLVATSTCTTWALAQSDDEATPAAAIHAQATYISQRKPAFHSSYSGPNSLSPDSEKSYSFTTTGDLGLRLWQGAQIHINPEGAQGMPLSNLLGVGSLSNGELARGSSDNLITYRARLFVQQRINAGAEMEVINPDFNEIGGKFAATRWTITLGNFALLDYFDNNPYAKDPRKQFMNWAFMTHGAWDYAADARGYTMGGIVEYRTPMWAVRGGRVMQPRESNGLLLDRALGTHYGDQLEIEGNLPLALPAGPMRARLLLFRNHIQAGNFADAIALGGVPDVSLVRRDQTKTGWGITFEAPLGQDEGLFLRMSRNSGNLETYAFTEIDRQLAVGSLFTGAAWGRKQDRWGVAWAVNGLSDLHRDYLAAGGLGFFLGDGKLNYGSERIFETYYRWVLPEWSIGVGKLQSALSGGFQHMTNPGYNRDRGPVQTYTLRWHSEF